MNQLHQSPPAARTTPAAGARRALFAAAALAGLLLASCDGSLAPYPPGPTGGPPPPPGRPSGPPPGLSGGTVAPPPAPIKPWLAKADWDGLSWDMSHAGQPLDMSRFGALIFDDEFDSCSIGKETFSPVGRYNWYSKASADHGLRGVVYTHFVHEDDPLGAPFACPGDGLLHTNAHFDPKDNTWHTGGIFAQDSSHEGFQTAYGYMEFKVRMNSAAAPLRPWAALWAWSREARNTAGNYNAHQYSELDLIETYHVKPDSGDQNITTYHYWPSGSQANGQEMKDHVWRSSPTETYSTFDDQWHTFGLAMTARYFIVYRDRAELARMPRVSEDMREPMTPIISFSSFFGPQGADTSKVYDVMDVDYVHVYGLARERDD